MINLKEFLNKLNIKYPPAQYCRHCLMVEDNKLILSVSTCDSKWHNFVIEESDLNKTDEELTNEIMKFLPVFKKRDSAEDVL